MLVHLAGDEESKGLDDMVRILHFLVKDIRDNVPVVYLLVYLSLETIGIHQSFHILIAQRHPRGDDVFLNFGDEHFIIIHGFDEGFKEPNELSDTRCIIGLNIFQNELQIVLEVPLIEPPLVVGNR